MGATLLGQGLLHAERVGDIALQEQRRVIAVSTAWPPRC